MEVEKLYLCFRDDFYKKEVQTKDKVYVIYPSLIKQRKSMSNIFNSVMDYKFT